VHWLRQKDKDGKEAANRFLVVFLDGSVHFYTKELQDSQIDLKGSVHLKGHQVQKETLIKLLVDTDSFDFEARYKGQKMARKVNEPTKTFTQSQYSQNGCMHSVENLTNKRYLNLVSCICNVSPKPVNPYGVIKMDCPSIN